MSHEDESNGSNFRFSGHLSPEVQEDIAELLKPRLTVLTVSVASLAFAVGAYAYKNRHWVRFEEVEDFLSDFVIKYNEALGSLNGLATFRYPLPDDPRKSQFLASVLSKDNAGIRKVDSSLLEPPLKSITETAMLLPDLFLQEVAYEIPGSSFWRKAKIVRQGSIVGEHNLISELNPVQTDAVFRARIILDKYPALKG